MEPAVELAVRITAHLWVLRDVFPEAERVGDNLQGERVGDLPHDWPEALAQAAEKNYALRARLGDLTAEEELPAERDPFAGTARGQDRYSKRTARQSAEQFASQIKSLPVPRNFLSFRAPGDLLTRDQVIDSLSEWLLANHTSLASIAGILNYIPSFARELLKKELSADWTDPGNLLAAADRAEVPVPFSMIQREELAEIQKSRDERLNTVRATRFDPNQPVLQLPPHNSHLPSAGASEMRLFGVALSGGGIRSATFSLGILQAMADRRLLGFVDYLSTVSGGGYIGSWLLAWTKRRGSIHSVEKSMRAADPMSDDVRPMRYLRTFSSYLAPDAAVFSADSWTILSTWLRNMALNLLVLLPFLASALLLPRVAALALVGLPALFPNLMFLALAGAFCLWGACYWIGRNLRVLGQVRRPGAAPESGDSDPRVLSSIVALVVLGSFFFTCVLWTGRNEISPLIAAGVGVAVYAAGLLIVGFVSGSIHPNAGWAVTVLAPLIGCAAGGTLLYLLCRFPLQGLAADSVRGVWVAVTLGGASLAAFMTAVIVMSNGIIGKDGSEEVREWWSRLGAWLTITILAWVAVATVAFFVPLWIARASALAVASGGLTWAAVTAAGVRLAASFKSGKNGDSSMAGIANLLLNVAPYLFMLGLLGILSFALYWGSGLLSSIPGIAGFFGIDLHQQTLCCAAGFPDFASMAGHYWALMYPGSGIWPALMTFLFLISLGFASRIDLNEFSMQNFYKNRLVRAYLGASRMRQHRWPNAFTSFDPDDDFPLSRLTRDDASQKDDEATDCSPGFNGPFPIVNTALNLTRGEDASRQERKAASFVFTPLRSGFDFTRKQTADSASALSEYGFRPTKDYSDPKGISLGSAVATSGAAANPNSGFHTSPALAFLLTVFNVRLGRWIGNPRGSRWRRSSPPLGLGYLLTELFGQTQVDSGYVQLSDGGHFDNMGLYELVRRRCRYIVVCDGEEDAAFKLEGIGGAIRKCRVDFGVLIDLDITRLIPDKETKFSQAHFVAGTIDYPGESAPGTIVYIKTSLKGDEPVDVKEFCKRYPAFPNESTANQFFDESHFESYRALGRHIGNAVFTKDAAELFAGEKNDLAVTLAEIFAAIQTEAAR